MRAVVALVAVLALLAVAGSVEAKRINRLKHELASEVSAALPFDGDYWTSAGRADIQKVLAAAPKQKGLTVAQILSQFFTPELILTSQQQKVGVKATIGTYKADAMTKSCTNGACDDKWTVKPLLAPSPGQILGGEGSVVLSCTTPADLTTAACTIDLFIANGANRLTSCSAVGTAAVKCSAPKYVYYGSGAGAFLTGNFVTDVAEIAEIFFTNDQLVVHWKYRGVSSSKLVGTDITVQSTPLSDFGTPLKTNCLSKTTTDAVLKAAAEKKGLKNKITLQKDAVDALIKSAPYATVQDAITKIKGIGPVNVVYVSFMWNFQC